MRTENEKRLDPRAVFRRAVGVFALVTLCSCAAFHPSPDAAESAASEEDAMRTLLDPEASSIDDLVSEQRDDG